MERVRWKGEHIIREVQDELDPDPELIMKEAEIIKRTQQNLQRKPLIKSMKMDKGSKILEAGYEETSDLTISEELSDLAS